MTDHTEIQHDSIVQTLVIDQSYKDGALKQVQKMVEGNQYSPEEVTLDKFEGEIVKFQAENMLMVLKKVTHKIVPGRLEGPKKVDSEQAAHNAIDAAYLALHEDRDTERRIRDVILNREDKGFALQDTIIELPFYKKEYVFFMPCQTCKSQGTVTCLPCHGKGVEQCARCNGSGMGHCAHCRGAQMVMGPNNHKIQCPVCHGRGRTGCLSCNQTGRIQCRVCRSRGFTSCPNCQGNAWNSHLYIMEIQVKTRFDYPRERIPEKLVRMIEEKGAKIIEYADIFISQAEESFVNMDDQDKMKEFEDADKKKDYRIPVIYEVSLPYGHIEYTINDKSYYTFLFGKKAELAHVSPFIDDLIKNGIRKLNDAAENRGDVSDNLRQAAEYRTVKEGIMSAAMHNAGRAKKALKRTNLLGLSDGAITDIIAKSNIALKNITKKPRQLALGLSTLFYIALFSSYFLTPLRNTFLSNIPNTSMHLFADVIILVSGLYIGALIIQGFAQNVLKKTLNAILPQQIKRTPPAKLGDIAWWNAIIAIIVFAVALELSLRTGDNAVSWYALLRFK